MLDRAKARCICRWADQPGGFIMHDSGAGESQGERLLIFKPPNPINRNDILYFCNLMLKPFNDCVVRTALV